MTVLRREGMFSGWHALGALLLLLFLVALCGCGAPYSGSSPLANRTNGAATGEQLVERWHRAQQHLATAPIPINAGYADVRGDAVKMLPPDPRALDVAPCCVAVIAVPDIPLHELPSDLQAGTSDPTHVIRCGSGAITQYCYSYLDGDVHVSQSWVLHDGTTDYEFENVILAKLGYDISGR